MITIVHRGRYDAAEDDDRPRQARGWGYIMTMFPGFGAATIIGKAYIAKNGGINMSAPLLAESGRRYVLYLNSGPGFAAPNRDPVRCDWVGNFGVSA